MTERWRKKLEGIDHVGPSDEVYERAKAGPRGSEPQSPMQRTSTRVVTAIAAFVVFALAISVFAIPALRLGGEPRSVTAGGQVQPLWPWSSTEDVKAWNEAPSPVGLTRSGDFFAPDSAATAFGREVLGWSEVWAHEEGSPQTFPCPLATGVAIAHSDMSPASSTGIRSCLIEPGGSLPPTIALYVPTTAAPAFRTFDLSTCPPSSTCDDAWPGPPNVSVVVYQPLGADGPWAVLEAKNEYVGLSLAPGTELHDGSTVYASGAFPSQMHAILGYDASLTGCDETGTTGSFEATNKDAGSDQAGGGVAFGTYARGQLDLSLPAQEASCVRQAGYAFVVISQQKIAFADVLHGLPGDAGVFAFAAVPVSFLFPSAQDSSGPTTSPSPGAPPGHGYTDSRGWTIDVPDGWITHPIEIGTADESWSGAWFGTGPPTDAVVTDPDRMTPGPGDFMLILVRHEHVGFNPPQDDSSLPLTFKQLAPVDGGFHIDFRADGQPFILSVRLGHGGWTSDRYAALEQMVSSIRFQPWDVGESRNGWMALEEQRSDVQVEAFGDVEVIVMKTPTGYVMLGPVTCDDGGGPSTSWTPSATCPDDSAQASWDERGRPMPGDAPGWDHQLDVHPVIRAWDGTLLTALATTAN